MIYNVQQYISRNPYGMDFTQTAYEEALMLIREAVQDERSDELFYDYLIDRAPTIEQREIITSIRDDERLHRELFKEIYKAFTGKTIEDTNDNEEFQKPISYIEGIKKALFGELSAMEKYRMIREGLPSRLYRDIVLRILTDEMKHAIKYNYILNVYDYNNSLNNNASDNSMKNNSTNVNMSNNSNNISPINNNMNTKSNNTNDIKNKSPNINQNNNLTSNNPNIEPFRDPYPPVRERPFRRSRFTMNEAMAMARALGIDFDNSKFTAEQFLLGLNTELEERRRNCPINRAECEPMFLGRTVLSRLEEDPNYYTK